jgi:hypothetical protein
VPASHRRGAAASERHWVWLPAALRRRQGRWCGGEAEVPEAEAVLASYFSKESERGRSSGAPSLKATKKPL